MNIFKMLSDGKGRLHEPSMSSFLCYLLDVNADHGMGSALLELFLKPIVLSNNNNNVFNILIRNDNVENLSVYSNFKVEIIPEFELEGDGDRGTRYIDILVEIWEEAQEAAPLYIFGIENKISDIADSQQLNDEICLLKHYRNTEYNNTQLPIGFVFLTPSKSTVNINDDEVKIKNLIWNKPQNDEKHEESIYCMLSEILKKEAHGECEPIFEYTRHTIKALMNFIESDFKLYSEEKAGEKGKKNLWGPERYDEFKSKYNSRSMFNLLEEIHNDITQKYKNIRIDIAPNNKRISYKIDDERKKGNKFFHIKLKSESELEGFLRVEDAKMIPVSYYERSNAYLPRIKSKEVIFPRFHGHRVKLGCHCI